MSMKNIPNTISFSKEEQSAADIGRKYKDLLYNAINKIDSFDTKLDKLNKNIDYKLSSLEQRISKRILTGIENHLTKIEPVLEDSKGNKILFEKLKVNLEKLFGVSLNEIQFLKQDIKESIKSNKEIIELLNQEFKPVNSSLKKLQNLSFNHNENQDKLSLSIKKIKQSLNDNTLAIETLDKNQLNSFSKIENSIKIGLDKLLPILQESKNHTGMLKDLYSKLEDTNKAIEHIPVLIGSLRISNHQETENVIKQIRNVTQSQNELNTNIHNNLKNFNREFLSNSKNSNTVIEEKVQTVSNNIDRKFSDLLNNLNSFQTRFLNVMEKSTQIIQKEYPQIVKDIKQENTTSFDKVSAQVIVLQNKMRDILVEIAKLNPIDQKKFKDEFDLKMNSRISQLQEILIKEIKANIIVLEQSVLKMILENND